MGESSQLNQQMETMALSFNQYVVINYVHRKKCRLREILPLLKNEVRSPAQVVFRPPSWNLQVSGFLASRLQATALIQSAGHSGEVFAARFDPAGQVIASGSMDRTISMVFTLKISSFSTLFISCWLTESFLPLVLWRNTGDCSNLGLLSGHKGAILDISFSRDSRCLFSASADTTIWSWDLTTGQRIRRHQGHSDIINSLCVSPRGEELLISGSDDACFSIWDPRTKHAVEFTATDFPITAVAVAEAGNELYTGGIDNNIKVWDMRKKAVIYTMLGHTDTVTSLEVSPDAQTLLSYSHDGLARTWDIRPFAPSDRSMKSYVGAPMGLEKNLIRASWDRRGARIASGSGDGTACIWDVASAKLLYKLPGHKGTVNDVRFSPVDEPLSEIILLLRVLVPAGLAGKLTSVSCVRIIRSYPDHWGVGTLSRSTKATI